LGTSPECWYASVVRSLLAEARAALRESKTATVVAPNLPDRKYLRRTILKQMEKLGSPRIRAYWNGKEWEAIEGSHRIAGAAELDIPVIISPVKLDQVFPNKDWTTKKLMIGDPDKWQVTTAEALAWFKKWNPKRPKYRVEVDVR